MKKLLLTFLFISFLQAEQYYKTFNTEYYIDDKRILLYKILNRWNISEIKDYNDPCGRNIKAKLSNGIGLSYKKELKSVTISFKNEFAKLLAPFSEDENTKNKKFFQLKWFNTIYLKNPISKIEPSSTNGISKIVLKNISYIEFQKLQAIKNNIEIELEGIIYGVFNKSSKLALNSSGRFFRKCENIKKYGAVLKIKNKNSNELLVEYSMQ